MAHKEMVFLKGFARGQKLYNLLKAINAASILHEGQLRKDGDPYINHPMRVTSALIALKIHNDDILSTAMLHDVLEDCNITTKELSEKYEINSGVINNVVALTKTEDMSIDEYYGRIMDFPVALLVKISDRCHNVSTMIKGFSHDKILDYTIETEEYILPLIKYGRSFYPHYSDQLFYMKYHIESVLQAVRGFL